MEVLKAILFASFVLSAVWAETDSDSTVESDTKAGLLGSLKNVLLPNLTGKNVKTNQPKEDDRSGRGYVESNCYCNLARDTGLPTVSESLNPTGKDEVERLVVTLYRVKKNPEQVYVYIPDRKKQFSAPDLELSPQDLLQPVTFKPFQDLFTNNPHVLTNNVFPNVPDFDTKNVSYKTKEVLLYREKFLYQFVRPKNPYVFLFETLVSYPGKLPAVFDKLSKDLYFTIKHRPEYLTSPSGAQIDLTALYHALKKEKLPSKDHKLKNYYYHHLHHHHHHYHRPGKNLFPTSPVDPLYPTTPFPTLPDLPSLEVPSPDTVNFDNLFPARPVDRPDFELYPVLNPTRPNFGPELQPLLPTRPTDEVFTPDLGPSTFEPFSPVDGYFPEQLEPAPEFVYPFTDFTNLFEPSKNESLPFYETGEELLPDFHLPNLTPYQPEYPAPLPAQPGLTDFLELPSTKTNKPLKAYDFLKPDHPSYYPVPDQFELPSQEYNFELTSPKYNFELPNTEYNFELPNTEYNIELPNTEYNFELPDSVDNFVLPGTVDKYKPFKPFKPLKPYKPFHHVKPLKPYETYPPDYYLPTLLPTRPVTNEFQVPSTVDNLEVPSIVDSFEVPNTVDSFELPGNVDTFEVPSVENLIVPSTVDENKPYPPVYPGLNQETAHSVDTFEVPNSVDTFELPGNVDTFEVPSVENLIVPGTVDKYTPNPPLYPGFNPETVHSVDTFEVPNTLDQFELPGNVDTFEVPSVENLIVPGTVDKNKPYPPLYPGFNQETVDYYNLPGQQPYQNTVNGYFGTGGLQYEVDNNFGFDVDTNPEVIKGNHTFDNWFEKEFASLGTELQGNTDYSTGYDIGAVKILIQGVLKTNGILLTKRGFLVSLDGQLIDTQELKLRPILVGNAIGLNKLFSQDTSKLKIPPHSYFLNILVTLGSSKVLGVVPVGKSNPFGLQHVETQNSGVVQLVRPGQTDGSSFQTLNHGAQLLRPDETAGSSFQTLNNGVVNLVRPGQTDGSSFQTLNNGVVNLVRPGHYGGSSVVSTPGTIVRYTVTRPVVYQGQVLYSKPKYERYRYVLSGQTKPVFQFGSAELSNAEMQYNVGNDNFLNVGQQKLDGPTFKANLGADYNSQALLNLLLSRKVDSRSDELDPDERTPDRKPPRPSRPRPDDWKKNEQRWESGKLNRPGRGRGRGRSAELSERAATNELEVEERTTGLAEDTEERTPETSSEPEEFTESLPAFRIMGGAEATQSGHAIKARGRSGRT